MKEHRPGARQRGRLWAQEEGHGWWLRLGSHKRCWACGSFEKVSEMKRHQFEQSFNLTDLLGLIRLNFPFVCNFLFNNLHLIEFLLKFLTMSLRSQHLLLWDISTSSHCKRKAKESRVSWEVGALLSTFMQLKLDFLRFNFFPKQCGNTWGSYGNGKRPGWLDRGGGRVAHRFHRYFRGFVPACSFRV